MSYDYDALVRSIDEHRATAYGGAPPLDYDLDVVVVDRDALGRAVEECGALSELCPLTPALWARYAVDAGRLADDGAAATRAGVLELGLAEFPGSTALRRWFAEEAAARAREDEDAVAEADAALAEALDWVGGGPRVGVDDDDADGNVAALWRAAASFAAKDEDQVRALFLRRARVPARRMNERLRDELSKALPDATAEYSKSVDEARREASRELDVVAAHEDAVREAAASEGATTRDDRSEGLGGAATANAYVKYAWAVAEEDRAAAVRVFERGACECPTAENLWTAYARFLSESDETVLLVDPEDVCRRAVRNCPYSVELVRERMRAIADADSATDVDLLERLSNAAKEATEARFLSSAEAYLDVHAEVARAVRRRLCRLVVESSDDGDADVVPYDGGTNVDSDDSRPRRRPLPPMDPDDLRDAVHDLVDDVREAFDAADLFVRKHYHNWNAGRATLWRERAAVEARVVRPILRRWPDAAADPYEETSRRRKRSKEKRDPTVAAIDAEAVRCFEKLTRIHPKCVDGWRDYADFAKTMTSTTPNDDGAPIDHLRRARDVYARAVRTATTVVGTTSGEDDDNQTTTIITDGAVLCREFVAFEETFGSLESVERAKKLVHIALRKRRTTSSSSPSGVGAETEESATTSHKRKRDEVMEQTDDEAASEKRSRSDPSDVTDGNAVMKDTSNGPSSANDDASAPNPTPVDSSNNDSDPKPTNLKVAKPAPAHYVTVHHLRHPAHPYTVRVTNLSPRTADMDLVRALKDRCGPIVHARVLRDHHHHKKKKNSAANDDDERRTALVQFEERESVERALALSEEVGLDERLIRIERSHRPAVNLVPGRGAVGEGKRKRRDDDDEKKKKSWKGKTKDAAEPRRDDDAGHGTKDEGNDAGAAASKTAQPTPNVDDETKTKKETTQNDFAAALAFRPRGVVNRHLRKKRIDSVPKK